MAEVKVLIEGHHTKNEDNRPKIGSTVTLIRGRSNILVDTGSFLDKDTLISGLEKEGLTPDDIDAVIITHLDLDHIVNTYLFRDAKIFCKFRGGEYPGQTHFPSEGSLERTDLLKRDLIDEDIEIILTPGHAEDMISVIVNTPEGKVVVAGDAFPSKEWMDLDRQPSPILTDVEKFNKSRKRILEVADYIVPGHGEMFKVKPAATSMAERKKIQLGGGIMKGIWKNVMMGAVCLLVAFSGIIPVGAKEMNAKHDAVVVGAGGAGLTAALTLALGGADVIVFEKMKFAGGSTNFAEGIFAVESSLQRRRNIMISKEEAFKEHMEFSHWRANARLVRAVIDKSGETIDWLMEQGVEFVDPMSLYPGGPRTWHVVKGDRHCAEIIKALVARLNERGIKISYETPVKGLIKTKEGKLAGVMAEDKEGNKIKAEAKAVIIATGGFANSKEMLSRYTKADPDLELLGNMGKTGDGIRMAFEAGAAEKGIDVVQLTGPYVKGERGISTLYACLSQPFLWINKLGERFMNEGTFKFPYVGNALAEQPDQIMYSIFDENSKRFVKEKGIDFGMGVYVPTGTRLVNIDEDIKRGMDNGQVFVADSIRELAEKIHVAPEALEATVNEYNRLCDKGQDDLFGKTSKYLYPVRAARFYAVRGSASATGTIGGVKINHKTEALDKDYRIIPGLYVAGNDAGGFYGDSYEATSSGGTMGFAINTGRIAGENALGFINR